MRLSVLELPAPAPAPGASPARPITGPRSISAVKVLRLSVTDRCNFRCTYCMPADGVPWLAKDSLLTFEEIADVVRAAVGVHGVRRFKLTGGEPTVRRGLTDLVAMLRRIDGVEDLSITTNGMLLEGMARPLREAGVDRVTVSLDSLDPGRFRRVTRVGDLATVLRGIDAAEAAGFASVKVNCVAVRGVNDGEAADFARLTLSRRLTVRFIEYMPLGDSAYADLAGRPGGRVADDEHGPAGGCGAQDRSVDAIDGGEGGDDGGDVFISEAEVRARVEAELGPLVPVDRATEPGVGPATVYRLRDGGVPGVGALGRVGFISAMSAPFCATCNRLRLTADGVLRSCLFEGGEVDVRPLLRDGAGDVRRRLADAMAACVAMKPDVHTGRGHTPMSRIGG